MLRFAKLLKRLHDNDVEFVVIGGVAVNLLGAEVGTFDLDVCAPLDDDNLQKLIRALRGLKPRYRFRPDKVFPFNSVNRFSGSKNIYLDTNWGVLDILGEVPGVGTYQDIRDRTVEMDIGGFRCRVLDLDTLIASKTAAGRDKDRIAIRQLEEIRRMKQKPAD